MSRALSTSLLFVVGPCAMFAACGGVDDDRSLRFGLPSSSGGSSSLSLGGADADAGDAPGGNGVAGNGGAEPGGAGGSSQGSTAGEAAGGTSSDGGTEPGGGTSPAGGGASAGASGSETSAGTSNGGSSSGAANGGNAGSGVDMGGSSGAPNDGPCGDIDQNQVQDCDETLAQNSRFEANASDWAAEFGISQEWKNEDARGKNGSGSLELKFVTAGAGNSWALAASGQCLPAWSEWAYEVGARVYIPEDQVGRTELSIAAYGNDACAGSYLGSVTAAQSSHAGAWHAISGTAKMPSGTRSVLVRLAVAKPGSQATFEARFDDVLFRKR